MREAVRRGGGPSSGGTRCRPGSLAGTWHAPVTGSRLTAGSLSCGWCRPGARLHPQGKIIGGERRSSSGPEQHRARVADSDKTPKVSAAGATMSTDADQRPTRLRWAMVCFWPYFVMVTVVGVRAVRVPARVYRSIPRQSRPQQQRWAIDAAQQGRAIATMTHGCRSRSNDGPSLRLPAPRRQHPWPIVAVRRVDMPASSLPPASPGPPRRPEDPQPTPGG